MRFKTVHCVLLGVCLLATAVSAGIPEPDAILYGNVTLNGVPQTVADNVTVTARVDGVAQSIGSYKLGDNVPAENRYVLRMRLESLADGSTQSSNKAAVGQTAHIYIQGF